MNSRIFAFSLLALALGGVAGCSDQRTPLGPSAHGSQAGLAVDAAKRDSTPPPIPIVQFAGASDAQAGGTSITRWVLGNDRNQAQTITWRLTDDAGWPSLPKSGSLVVPKNSTRLLEVSVAVPDSTAPNFYSIHMAATLRRETGRADGVIHVTARPDTIPPDSLRFGGRTQR